jgi:hypothetical protein
MRKNLYVSVAGLALVSALAACGSGSPPSSAPATPPVASSTPSTPAKPGNGNAAPGGGQKPDRCHTAELRGSLHKYEWPMQAGALQNAELGLTNTGRRACVVYGYPGLQLVGADGKDRPTKVTRSKTKQARTVTLAPGATAWAGIGWVFTPHGDEQDSEPLCGGPVAQLKVIPPDESTQLTVVEKIGTVCEHGNVYADPFQATRPSKGTPPGSK